MIHVQKSDIGRSGEIALSLLSISIFLLYKRKYLKAGTIQKGTLLA